MRMEVWLYTNGGVVVVRLTLATPLSYTSLAKQSPQVPHKQG